MKLTGKVTRIESGSSFVDKAQRVVIKLRENGSTYDRLEIVNEDGWKLDDEIEFFVFRKLTEEEEKAAAEKLRAVPDIDKLPPHLQTEMLP